MKTDDNVAAARASTGGALAGEALAGGALTYGFGDLRLSLYADSLVLVPYILTVTNTSLDMETTNG